MRALSQGQLGGLALAQGQAWELGNLKLEGGAGRRLCDADGPGQRRVRAGRLAAFQVPDVTDRRALKVPM